MKDYIDILANMFVATNILSLHLVVQPHMTCPRHSAFDADKCQVTQ
jgi:hypothetical protein